jgi:hypothetical protein
MIRGTDGEPIRDRHSCRHLAACWLVGLALLLAASVYVCDGHLIYSLDDPYIELAVADRILDGGYGINAAEFSTPVSSIAYPFLLAPTQSLGLGSAGALVINLLAMLAAVFILGRILKDHVLSVLPTEARAAGWRWPLAFGLSMCAVMNAWGLVMLGMEHSLHVLAVLAVLWGFLRVIDDGRSAPWLPWAIVALPMIRFEGLAMATFAIAALAFLGRYRSAIIATTVTLVLMLLWYAFMHAHGGSFLPGSVLVKSRIAADAVDHAGMRALVRVIAANLSDSLTSPQGIVLTVALMLLAYLSIDGCRQHATRRLAMVTGGLGLATGLAHLVFGRYGWFSRYEVYVFVVVAASCLCVGRRYLIDPRIRILAVFGLLSMAYAFMVDTLRTPAAARNVYQQQYQMHRFAVDYWKRPVAVNDIGYVSFHNPSYVLDLAGLASEEVRRLAKDPNVDASSLDDLVNRHQVALIMIYEGWFASFVPRDWRKVAQLDTSRVTASSGSVSFYVTPSAPASEVQSLLHQFGTTMPSGAYLHIDIDVPVH